MKSKRSHQKQTRGWYPNDPKFFITSKATHSRKLEKWIANPFSAMAAITIISSLISAVLGTTLVLVYLEPVPAGATVLYTGLAAGIFSLAAFVLGLYSGISLLSRKHITRATTAMAAVLACGVATLLAPIIERIAAPFAGVYVASPMIISSVAALCILGLNMNSQSTKLATQQPPTFRQRVFAGLSISGVGLIVIGIFFYFAPVYPKNMAVITTLAIGIHLLIAAFVVKMKQKNEAVCP